MMICLSKKASLLLSSVILCLPARGQILGGYRYYGKSYPHDNVVTDSFQFNGYTNFWYDVNHDWVLYGNLFKIAFDDIDYTIAQTRRDIADDMGIPVLYLQEGYMNSLLASDFEIMYQPSLSDIEKKASKNNILLLADPSTETGKKLAEG